MTDDRIAALAEALDVTRNHGDGANRAAAILAALSPDWCGHDAASLATHGWHAVEVHEIARLRKALESIAANTCCDGCGEAARWARAALEADHD